jgi:hypothetical protein
LSHEDNSDTRSSCPRLSRASTSFMQVKKKDVDGRDEPGRDRKRTPLVRNERILK